MEIDKTSPRFMAAMRDFRRARQRAVLEDILAQLTGKSDDLLDYDEVLEKLKAGGPVERGLQQIPLNAIIGSVGRYTDFTRSFLPRAKNRADRWAEVKAAIDKLGHIPPIIVYQIDQVYFVLDGNHRVSIARQRGDTHIAAYVTEIQSEVPLSPDVQPDELIIKAGYANFLRRTQFHQIRPNVDLSLTVPGKYRVLEEQIELHHRRLAPLYDDDDTPLNVVARWYNDVYWPIVQIIRQRGILRYFPRRTETDLYVWLVQHQDELKRMLGWEVDPETAAHDLLLLQTAKPKDPLSWMRAKVRRAVAPESLDAGPPPGQWRKEWLPGHQERLFQDIVVTVSGDVDQWPALEQALMVARRDKSRVHGLCFVVNDYAQNDKWRRRLQAEFQHRCTAASVPGELAIETGRPVATVCNRARWADLVVMHANQLPRPQPGDRYRSEFGALVRRCPRPVLAVPDQPAALNRALLAYDGSPKANEALFVAAYLAAKWQIGLVVVTVLEAGQITSATLEAAQTYLQERDVPASYVQQQGEISPAITGAAQQHACDFIIMGGYGFNPVLEVMLGSEVDQVLRAKQWPVLICR